MLVEPGALDVKELEAGHEASEGERVGRQPGDWFVGTRVGLVVEDVHRAIAYLQKIDVAGHRAFGRSHLRHQLDPVLRLKRSDVLLGQPNGISIATITLSLVSMKRWSVSCRNLLLPTLWNDQAGDMRGGVLLAIDDDAGRARESRMSVLIR